MVQDTFNILAFIKQECNLLALKFVLEGAEGEGGRCGGGGGEKKVVKEGGGQGGGFKSPPPPPQNYFFMTELQVDCAESISKV